ncbi:MAG: TlpA family protein disulfide reductase [Hyphomicrobiales bacterium]|nr:TlpA family protein disulfide reductase [Hyphomicrobiales bacterium]
MARQRRLLLLAAIAAVVGTIAVYVSGGSPINGLTPAPKANRVATLPNVGQMAAFVIRPEPQAMPELRFQTGSGEPRTVADWKGRVVLMNLWATWCAPCIKELPDLARLQAELGSSEFEVVAVSVDRTGVAGAQRFLEKTGSTALALYVDPTARLANTVGALGLPATILIGRDGREIGRLLGPAEWASDDAKALIRWALK